MLAKRSLRRPQKCSPTCFMQTSGLEEWKKTQGNEGNARPVPAPLTSQVDWPGTAAGRAHRVQLSAKLSISMAHGLWHSWDLTPHAMQQRTNKFVLYMPLWCRQTEQRALASTDMGSIQSTRAEIRGSPHLLPETRWPPLPPFSLALLKIIQKSATYFLNCLCFRGFFPVFLRLIKNKSLPGRWQEEKKKRCLISLDLAYKDLTHKRIMSLSTFQQTFRKFHLSTSLAG